MMNLAEVADLLKRINSYDGRKIDDKGIVAAWVTAAQNGRWTHAAACAALDEFFAMPHDPTKGSRWLEPGHITYLIRRRSPSLRTLDELHADPVRGLSPRGPGSSPEHRAACMAAVSGQLDRQLGRPSRVKAREPWHDGPIDRPERAIGAAEVRAIVANIEGAASAVGRRLAADTA